ncbi:ribosome assembly cofactor RimP [Phaeodactylibacter sp.]|uniref:ribosome assembly cofactor RimP n=1 Tax=Phaeodactylibacter sp. TaxID=1940289 RepID=UPI0025E6488F|nr:ribosome assembly cofactor RimP [Phaeodactylibacter sp.]MCI4648871.1 ribosome assembly cofactor RimP [Phaeodactylibacter sp.]MCI5092834.1 ribosome assembly cofactor RimP [Phaeodactylibacter sp.]
MVEDKIAALLEEKFREDAFADCFLVDLKLHAHNKLDVFLDSDFGITFEKCHKISRYLEQYLDEEQWLGEKYVLEVSSPGISRPLVMQRQYPRNIGRKVEVKLNDGDKRTGTLIEVEEDHIVLEEKVRVQEGKRKKTEVVETEISFSSIEHTKVKVTF